MKTPVRGVTFQAGFDFEGPKLQFQEKYGQQSLFVEGLSYIKAQKVVLTSMTSIHKPFKSIKRPFITLKKPLNIRTSRTKKCHVV